MWMDGCVPGLNSASTGCDSAACVDPKAMVALYEVHPFRRPAERQTWFFFIASRRPGQSLQSRLPCDPLLSGLLSICISPIFDAAKIPPSSHQPLFVNPSLPSTNCTLAPDRDLLRRGFGRHYPSDPGSYIVRPRFSALNLSVSVPSISSANDPSSPNANPPFRLSHPLETPWRLIQEDYSLPALACSA